MSSLSWASLLAEEFILWFTLRKMCPPWIKQFGQARTISFIEGINHLEQSQILPHPWLITGHRLSFPTPWSPQQSLGAQTDVKHHFLLLTAHSGVWVHRSFRTTTSIPTPAVSHLKKHGMGPLYYTVFSLPWAYWWHPDNQAVREKHRMTVLFDCLFPWFSLLDWLCVLTCISKLPAFTLIDIQQNLLIKWYLFEFCIHMNSVSWLYPHCSYFLSNLS